VPAKVAGELGLPFCLSTAGSQPIEAVAAANDAGGAHKNESNSVWRYDGPNGQQERAKGPRFFQLYMGHDDEIVSGPVWVMRSRELMGGQTISLLERAWKAGFDVLMLTVDTWQLGWRPTDINIANYVCVRVRVASVGVPDVRAAGSTTRPAKSGTRLARATPSS
jgi:isopentenyl diphosphate isomerase/L-lactate dehydrogenase-like FMN-dependent dehydrogenase